MTLVWKDLTDKEKVRLVLSQVLGHYIMPDGVYVRGQLEMQRPAPKGFHWPIAFWNDEADSWMVKEIHSDPKWFDPLHDMKNAWLIVELMAARMDDYDWRDKLRFRWDGPTYKGDSYIRASFPRMLDFTTGEFRGDFMEGKCWFVEVEFKGYRYTTLADTPHEAICIAALRIAGSRVLPEEPKPMHLPALERMWKQASLTEEETEQ